MHRETEKDSKSGAFITHRPKGVRGGDCCLNLELNTSI